MTQNEVREAILSVVPGARFRFEEHPDDTLCFAQVDIAGREYTMGFVFGGESALTPDSLREQVKGAYERALERAGKAPLVEFGWCEVEYDKESAAKALAAAEQSTAVARTPAAVGAFRRYHYDMIGADLAGETRHPEKVIRELAPSASRLQPESIADCWLFVSREIDPLPSFIRELSICSKRVECGGTCVLDAEHDGGCECIGDTEGEPGSCPA